MELVASMPDRSRLLPRNTVKPSTVKASPRTQQLTSRSELNSVLVSNYEEAKLASQDKFKELIIEEGDVMVTRNYLMRNSSDFDILKFDEDAEYKRLFFYTINPQVIVGRCPKVAKLMQKDSTNEISRKASAFVSEINKSALKKAPQKYNLKNKNSDRIYDKSDIETKKRKTGSAENLNITSDLEVCQKKPHRERQNNIMNKTNNGNELHNVDLKKIKELNLNSAFETEQVKRVNISRNTRTNANDETTEDGSTKNVINTEIQKNLKKISTRLPNYQTKCEEQNAGETSKLLKHSSKMKDNDTNLFEAVKISPKKVKARKQTAKRPDSVIINVSESKSNTTMRKKDIHDSNVDNSEMTTEDKSLKEATIRSWKNKFNSSKTNNNHKILVDLNEGNSEKELKTKEVARNIQIKLTETNSSKNNSGKEKRQFLHANEMLRNKTNAVKGNINDRNNNMTDTNDENSKVEECKTRTRQYNTNKQTNDNDSNEKLQNNSYRNKKQEQNALNSKNIEGTLSIISYHDSDIFARPVNGETKSLVTNPTTRLERNFAKKTVKPSKMQAPKKSSSAPKGLIKNNHKKLKQNASNLADEILMSRSEFNLVSNNKKAKLASQEKFKELIIEEGDVMVARNYLMRNSSDFDILKFDENAEYKRLFFYTINPQVIVWTCPKVAKLLQKDSTNEINRKASASVLEINKSVLKKAPQRYNLKNWNSDRNYDKSDIENKKRKMGSAENVNITSDSKVCQKRPHRELQNNTMNKTDNGNELHNVDLRKNNELDLNSAFDIEQVKRVNICSNTCTNANDETTEVISTKNIINRYAQKNLKKYSTNLPNYQTKREEQNAGETLKLLNHRSTMKDNDTNHFEADKISPKKAKARKQTAKQPDSDIINVSERKSNTTMTKKDIHVSNVDNSEMTTIRSKKNKLNSSRTNNNHTIPLDLNEGTSEKKLGTKEVAKKIQIKLTETNSSKNDPGEEFTANEMLRNKTNAVKGNINDRNNNMTDTNYENFKVKVGKTGTRQKKPKNNITKNTNVNDSNEHLRNNSHRNKKHEKNKLNSENNEGTLRLISYYDSDSLARPVIGETKSLVTNPTTRLERSLSGKTDKHSTVKAFLGIQSVTKIDAATLSTLSSQKLMFPNSLNLKSDKIRSESTNSDENTQTQIKTPQKTDKIAGLDRVSPKKKERLELHKADFTQCKRKRSERSDSLERVALRKAIKGHDTNILRNDSEYVKTTSMQKRRRRDGTSNISQYLLPNKRMKRAKSVANFKFHNAKKTNPALKSLIKNNSEKLKQCARNLTDDVLTSRSKVNSELVSNDEKSKLARQDKFKELIIEEGDVMVTRNYLMRNSSDFDILKFDEDSEYKRLFFYTINPQVIVGRSPKVAKLLQKDSTNEISRKASASVSEINKSALKKAPQNYNLKNRNSDRNYDKSDIETKKRKTGSAENLNITSDLEVCQKETHRERQNNIMNKTNNGNELHNVDLKKIKELGLNSAFETEQVKRVNISRNTRTNANDETTEDGSTKNVINREIQKNLKKNCTRLPNYQTKCEEQNAGETSKRSKMKDNDTNLFEADKLSPKKVIARKQTAKRLDSDIINVVKLLQKDSTNKISLKDFAFQLGLIPISEINKSLLKKVPQRYKLRHRSSDRDNNKSNNEINK